MKYILILIVIIGLVTYIFLGGPKALSSQDRPQIDRRAEVWERVAYLESRRREMLTQAKGRLGSGQRRSYQAATGVYYAGYRDGFTQGYYEGSFLSAQRKPDPLFFKVPNP
ncbi:hypothetical protein [Solidesulfovibrio sp.]